MSGRNISDSLLLLKYPISSCLLQGAIALQQANQFCALQAIAKDTNVKKDW